jgi:chromosome segregation ATPase
MSDSDAESVSLLTSGESEDEDLLEKFESLQQKLKFQTTLSQHQETWTNQDDHTEKITKLNLTVGQLYEPNDTLYSLVGDVGKDYGTRLQQAIALLSERDANCTDLQQRLLALELNRDDVREELEGRLSSLEERHSKALEELVSKDDQYRELQQQLTLTRDSLQKDVIQERRSRTLTEQKLERLTEELNDLKQRLQNESDSTAAVTADCEKWKKAAGNWEQDMNTLLTLLNSQQLLDKEPMSAITFRMVTQDAVIGTLTNVTNKRHRVGELEVEVASLQTQVSNREKRVQELEHYLDQMKERYEKSMTEMTDSHTVAVRHLEEETRNTRERQSISLQQMGEKDGTIEKLQRELQQFHKQTTYLEEQLKLKQAAIESVEKQRDAAEKLLETTSQTLDQLRCDLEEAQQSSVRQMKALQAEMEGAQVEAIAKSSFLSDEISQYKTRIATLQEEVALQTTKLQDSTEMVTQRENTIHRLELELLENQQHQQQLGIEMQRHETTIDKLNKEVEEARQKLEFAKHRANDIDKQLDAYKTIAAADKSQLEDELKQHKNILASLQTELSDLQEQHRHCQDEVEHREEIIEQLKRQYTEAENEFTVHETSVTQMEKELAEMREREAESQHQIEEAEAMINRLNDDIERLRRDKESSDFQRAEFQSEVNSLSLDKKLLEQKQQDYSEKLAYQDEMLGTLRESSRLLEQRYEKAVIEVGSMLLCGHAPL